MRALLLSLLIAAATPAAAESAWRSSEGTGHYFVLDQQTNEWVETIDCNAVFRFKVSEVGGTYIVLHDASRNMFVQLTRTAMWLWPNGATAWSKYRRGAFDDRIVFMHEDASGGISGAFWLKPACRWHEHLGGTATPDFLFKETSVTASSVTMYDYGRNMYARIDRDAIYLRQGSGAFGFFKRGSWE